MYLDNNLLVSGSVSGNTVTPQSIATSGNVLSTNTVDLGTARDIGQGTDYPELHAFIGTAVAGGTSTEFQVITADDAALTTNVTVVGSSGAIATAALTAGKRIAVMINPQITNTVRRYLGARYVITGTNSAGTVTAHFGLDLQDGQRFYASGFSVS